MRPRHSQAKTCEVSLTKAVPTEGGFTQIGMSATISSRTKKDLACRGTAARSEEKGASPTIQGHVLVRAASRTGVAN